VPLFYEHGLAVLNTGNSFKLFPLSVQTTSQEISAIVISIVTCLYTWDTVSTKNISHFMLFWKLCGKKDSSENDAAKKIHLNCLEPSLS
jgi:hypothetical protein